jgi:hypothetical protein
MVMGIAMIMPTTVSVGLMMVLVMMVMMIR